MKTTGITLIACVLYFLGASQTTQGQVSKQKVQEITIPIDMTTHRPIIEVMIDEKGPYTFIFDTGSTTNIIDESLNKEFGFKVVGEDPLMTPGSKNRLASKRVAVPQVKLARTNISKDVEMNVISLRAMLPVDGILGGFFLEEYLLTIDYPNSKLILTLGELNKTAKDVVPFIQDARSINMNIDIDGNNVEAHLDSGNPYSITLPNSLRDKLTFKETPRKGLPMRTPVATFESWEAELVGNITIGNAVFKNPRVRLAEGFKYVNLGYAIINELLITIDRKNNLIKLERIEGTSSQKIEKAVRQKINPQASPFAGTYEGDRKVLINESGALTYYRAGMPISMKLVKIKDDLFEMKVPEGVYSPQEIPKVYFLRDTNKNISGIQFIYKERKDGPFKKIN